MKAVQSVVLSRAPRSAGAGAIEVRPVSPDDREAWDLIAESSDDAWLTHTWQWNEAIEGRVMGGERRSVVALSGDRIVGILPLHMHDRSRGAFRRRVLYTNYWAGGGLALANDIAGEQRQAYFDAIFCAIADQARRDRADKLMLFLPPLARRNLRGDTDARRGLERPGVSDRSSTALVMYLAGRTADEVWASMEGRARTKARKAERAGVSVELARPHEAFDIVYPLHLATCERTGASPYPPEYFVATLASGHFHIFAARLGGRLIGALSLALFGGRALFDVSASLEDALRLGANNLLLWRSIQWLIGVGAEAFELGQIPGPSLDESKKLASIAYHHRSFGPRVLPAYGGQLVYQPAREIVFTVARDLAARAAKIGSRFALGVGVAGAELSAFDLVGFD